MDLYQPLCAMAGLLNFKYHRRYTSPTLISAHATKSSLHGASFKGSGSNLWCQSIPYSQTYQSGPQFCQGIFSKNLTFAYKRPPFVGGIWLFYVRKKRIFWRKRRLLHRQWTNNSKSIAMPFGDMKWGILQCIFIGKGNKIVKDYASNLLCAFCWQFFFWNV